jgi:pimeloyl-ACP methyl ester carboxylesterase
MRFLTVLVIAASGLLTACATGVTTTVPAHPPHADARPHALPGYIRGSKESHADRVIVFIHGVFGDGTSTWTNPATGAYFPALIRDDKTFDGVDIWVHEFDTPKLRRTYTIDELADHLRKYLNNDNVIANHRQVIFVCHSLGGLVARAYLLKYRLPVSQVPMIYFFSTPTTGADVATLASFISANPQLTDMRKMTTDSPGLIGAWQSQWAASEYNHTTLSYCGYETLPIHGVQIVQRESATNLCNTRYDPIRRDHIAIVKPSDNTSDESYVAFRGAYRETFEHHSDLGRSPLWNLTSNDPALLRVQNVTQQHDCTSICWSDHVAVAPGDDITFNLSYQNAGPATAKDARVYLSIPREPLGSWQITARLVASNAETTYGMVALVTTGGPVLLTPIDAWAYEKNDATKTHDMPYQQGAGLLTSTEGLRLGDVAPDEVHHHIVVRFHCEPVTLVGLANIETLFPVIKKLLSKESECLCLSTGSAGHIDSGEIGEHTWWVSDLSDVRDDSNLVFYLNHFNGTAQVQRHLRANVGLDPDDPSTLRLTLTSADGPIRSASAKLAYRPGTTQRPIMMGAWHIPKAPVAMLQHLASMSDQELEEKFDLAPWPVQGDDIDLGDLPPQTQVAAVIGYSMDASEALVKPEPIPPELQTVLNGAEGEVVLKVANTPVHSSAWAQYLPGFKSEWPLWIGITAHNTGHAIAKDVRLHLSMDVTADQLEARGRVTARNAPERAGMARVALVPRSPRTTFYYDQGYLFRSGTPYSRNLDASKITAEGVEIGDLDPDEWIFLSIEFIAGSSASDDAVEDLVMTPERYFETLLRLDNTTTKIMHDVVLFTHTAGGPEEVLVTSTLSSAGQVLRSKTVRLHASVPGITLRYSNAKVFAATGAKAIDAGNASGKGVFIGDLPPGAQMVVRVGYEVLANAD